MENHFNFKYPTDLDPNDSRSSCQLRDDALKIKLLGVLKQFEDRKALPHAKTSKVVRRSKTASK